MTALPKTCEHGTLVRAKTGGWYCISQTGCEFAIPEPAPQTSNYESLRVDAEREGGHLRTGVFVRAQLPNDRWDSVDISDLQRESLLRWLRSRGGSNPWAESLVLILLGHDGLTKDESAPETLAPRNPLDLALRFHETYERLAPSFGYETRPDTKAFDAGSNNGRLMVAVCAELLGISGAPARLPQMVAQQAERIRNQMEAEHSAEKSEAPPPIDPYTPKKRPESNQPSAFEQTAPPLWDSNEQLSAPPAEHPAGPSTLPAPGSEPEAGGADHG